MGTPPWRCLGTPPWRCFCFLFRKTALAERAQRLQRCRVGAARVRDHVDQQVTVDVSAELADEPARVLAGREVILESGGRHAAFEKDRHDRKQRPFLDDRDEASGAGGSL